jgi:death on curing protein
MDWVWIGRDAALATHAEQLAEHGGADGIRDINGLESALARPQNLSAYGNPSAAAPAAAYAFGIARNHPFVDGNKRTAAVVSVSFLFVNGYEFTAMPAELTLAFLALAAGERSEEEMADWFRSYIVPA